MQNLPSWSSNFWTSRVRDKDFEMKYKNVFFYIMNVGIDMVVFFKGQFYGSCSLIII